jgi:hypothetical protein
MEKENEVFEGFDNLSVSQAMDMYGINELLYTNLDSVNFDINFPERGEFEVVDSKPCKNELN